MSNYSSGCNSTSNGLLRETVVLSTERITLGRREWLRLPELGIPAIKAKVDTGAGTSASHAFDVRESLGRGVRRRGVRRRGVRRVGFRIQSMQRDSSTVTTCKADVIDEREVTDSGVHKEMRVTIISMLALCRKQSPNEFTSSARGNMLFRTLLGQTAIRRMAVVDPSRSYGVVKKSKRTNRLELS